MNNTKLSDSDFSINVRVVRQSRAILLTALILVAPFPQMSADEALETETARLLAPGRFSLGAAFEFQTSSSGKEYATPLALEAGVIKDLEAMIEFVPFTSIQASEGGSANGVGDTEATLAYLGLNEKEYFPAIAVAGEVKLPTASNTLIGSGEFDYRPFIIFSKQIGDVDLHFNIGYNFIGKPVVADSMCPSSYHRACHFGPIPPCWAPSCPICCRMPSSTLRRGVASPAELPAVLGPSR